MNNTIESTISGSHAIIVLANLMDAQGNLNQESRARMDVAIAAFQAQEAPFIITTGWDYREDSDIPIAEAMRDYATSHDIPTEAIICDLYARDTVGDAVFTKRNIIQPRGWKRLLVITSDYHTQRAAEIFQFIYGSGYDITVRGATIPDSARLAEKEAESLAVFRATFDGIQAGDDPAIWERLKQRHPFYNGNIYPKI
jgi:uncharacterized SAM-binding protein YcdF (DUF218 family)